MNIRVTKESFPYVKSILVLMFVIRLMSLPKKNVILNTAGENSLTQLTLVYVLQWGAQSNSKPLHNQIVNLETFIISTLCMLRDNFGMQCSERNF